MINLSQRTEPYELELPYGLTVTVKPLTTAGMAAAQAAALPKKPTPELKQMWRELYDKEPPGFSRSYLINRLAYRIIEREVTVLLAEFATVWNELFPAEQARIIQLLVERVDVQEDSLEVMS